MQRFSKYTLPLLAILVSTVGISNSVLAQYTYGWQNQGNTSYSRFKQDQEYIRRMNRIEACRRSSYNFDDSHCNYIR